jgi:hypothetical protein
MRRGVGVQLKEEKHGLERIHKKYKVFELAIWCGQKRPTIKRCGLSI